MNHFSEGNYFYKLIENRQFSDLTDVKKCCLLLVKYLLIVARDLEVSFHFEELRDVIDFSINEEDFITSVYYLTRPDILILEQGFSAWRDIEDRYIPIDAKIVLTILSTHNYHHPITGEELSREEFNDQIIPYFSATQYFLDHKND